MRRGSRDVDGLVARVPAADNVPHGCTARMSPRGRARTNGHGVLGLCACQGVMESLVARVVLNAERHHAYRMVTIP